MIETKVSWISMLDEDTLRVEFKPDAFVDVEEFQENLRAYKKLITTERVFMLTVANPGAETSVEVRNLFSSPERSSFKYAEALVISSLAQKLMANFVIKVQKPHHPLRFFNDEKDALKWLKEQKEKELAKS
jgi:hypothetical protein